MSDLSKRQKIAGIICLTMIIILAVVIALGVHNQNKVEKRLMDSRVALEYIIENINFEERYPEKVFISTDQQMLVFQKRDVSFFETENKNNKIKYTRDDEGTTYEPEIYLNKEGIKKYSTLYAKEFSETLKIRTNNDKS